jgi:hypothetical protein
MPSQKQNFSNTEPAAPVGYVNVIWQSDEPGPVGTTRNISAYVPASSDAPFTTSPLTIAAPNGGTTYTLPITPAHPTGSFYFVNGIKRIYGVYYSISGNTLTELAATPPQTGDSHEIYAA